MDRTGHAAVTCTSDGVKAGYPSACGSMHAAGAVHGASRRSSPRALWPTSELPMSADCRSALRGCKAVLIQQSAQARTDFALKAVQCILVCLRAVLACSTSHLHHWAGRRLCHEPSQSSSASCCLSVHLRRDAPDCFTKDSPSHCCCCWLLSLVKVFRLTAIRLIGCRKE